MKARAPRKKAAKPATSADTASFVRIAYLIGRLDRALRKAIATAVEPMDLTLQQYTALSVLKVHEELSNAELAERSLMTPQSANEMVKALEAKALVVRRPHPNHGRIIHLQLTADGRRALRKADAAVLEIERRMLSNLAHRDHGKFRDQLKRCLGALVESTTELS